MPDGPGIGVLLELREPGRSVSFDPSPHAHPLRRLLFWPRALKHRRHDPVQRRDVQVDIEVEDRLHLDRLVRAEPIRPSPRPRSDARQLIAERVDERARPLGRERCAGRQCVGARRTTTTRSRRAGHDAYERDEAASACERCARRSSVGALASARARYSSARVLRAPQDARTSPRRFGR